MSSEPAYLAPDPLLVSAMAALSEPGYRRGWIDPSKQSVAVLPFVNLSGDTEQEYFADGITEDIITELARFSNLFVASRNSSFHFKGRTGLVQQIGTEIGVKFVVEGSVRRAGNRVRVNSQLVETATGGHLWVERFDRDISDIFAVQDDVVQSIASSIPGALSRQALEGARRKPPENHSAYECELRGRWAFAHWSEGNEEAITWFRRTVAADPEYATGLAWLARCLKYSTLVGKSPTEGVTTEALTLIQKAVCLEDRNPSVHTCAAGIYLGTGNSSLAIVHAKRACECNPNDPDALVTMALVLTYTGSPKEALEWHARSERVEPYAPDDQRLDILCDTYYLLRQYDKVALLHTAYRNAPPAILDVLAAALAQSGKIEKAREALQRMRESGFTMDDSIRSIRVQQLYCSRQEDRDHWLEGYRKAGLDL